jgi:hypothetical protein
VGTTNYPYFSPHGEGMPQGVLPCPCRGLLDNNLCQRKLKVLGSQHSNKMHSGVYVWVMPCTLKLTCFPLPRRNSTRLQLNHSSDITVVNIPRQYDPLQAFSRRRSQAVPISTRRSQAGMRKGSTYSPQGFAYPGQSPKPPQEGSIPPLAKPDR